MRASFELYLDYYMTVNRRDLSWALCRPVTMTTSMKAATVREVFTGLPNTSLGQGPVIWEIELADPSGTFGAVEWEAGG